MLRVAADYLFMEHPEWTALPLSSSAGYVVIVSATCRGPH